MNKDISKIIVLIVFDIVFIVGLVFFVGYRNTTDNTKSNKRDTEINTKTEEKEKSIPKDYDKSKYDINEIIKYEVRTRNAYRVNKEKNKFYIDSEEELNKFHSLFSNEINVDKEYLYNNVVFVQVEETNSGAIKLKLNNVSINNDVEFVYERDVPEGMTTDDMAYWYLVAIIPKDKLNNVDYASVWIKPSSVTKNKYGNYQ